MLRCRRQRRVDVIINDGDAWDVLMRVRMMASWRDNISKEAIASCRGEAGGQRRIVTFRLAKPYHGDNHW